MASDVQRFMADEMLGSLARWLRVLGYDTSYQRGSTDLELLRAAQTTMSISYNA